MPPKPKELLSQSCIQGWRTLAYPLLVFYFGICGVNLGIWRTQKGDLALQRAEALFPKSAGMCEALWAKSAF